MAYLIQEGDLLISKKYNDILKQCRIKFNKFDTKKNMWPIFKLMSKVFKKISFKKAYIKIISHRIAKVFLKFRKSKAFLDLYSLLGYKYLLCHRISNNFNSIKNILICYLKNYIFKLCKSLSFKLKSTKGFLSFSMQSFVFYFSKKLVTTNFSLYFYFSTLRKKNYFFFNVINVV